MVCFFSFLDVYDMKLTRMILFLLMVTGACFGLGTVAAQSAAEVRFVRAINPRYPDNFIFKSLSSTDKPLAVAIPFGIMAISLINNNQEGQRNAYEIVAGLALSTVATEAIKVIVKRPRPYQTYSDIYPDQIDNGNSFPSGHTSIAFSTATSLTLIYKKWYIAVPAFAWASGVGYSRMYLGQHYPSDVVAGAVVGAAGAYAAHWLNKKLFRRKK